MTCFARAVETGSFSAAGRDLAALAGGKGGGKPDLAMAGGTDATNLDAALASVQAWVTERL